MKRAVNLPGALSGSPLTRLGHNVAGVLRRADPVTAVRFAGALLTRAPQIVSSRSLVPADRAMAGRPARFDVDGTYVEVDGADFSAAREMYGRRVYLSHPNVELRPSSVVVDLGANIGLFTTLAARRGCRVLAVEAQRGFRREIERRLERNGVGDLVTIETALVGGAEGLLADPAKLETASHYEPGQELPSVTMAELLSKHAVERVDFLKMDVEGSEFAILREPEPWLERVQQIAMEVHPEFGDPHQLETVLQGAGMRTTLTDDLLRADHAPTQRGGYLFAWR